MSKTVNNSPSHFFSNITKNSKAIWTVPQSTEKVHYPDNGHKELLEVEDNSFWYKSRNKYITWLLKKHKVAPVFFDIGGGNGYVSREIEKNIPCILVEPGNGAYSAKKRGVHSVVQASFDDLNITNTLTSVGLFDVIEHIKNDKEFLSKINNNQKSGDSIIITVPALSILWSKDDEYAVHHRRYSKKSLIKLLKASGYMPIMTSYLFSYLFLPILLLRALPYKLNIQIDQTPEKIKKDHASSGLLLKLVSKVFSLLTTIEFLMLKTHIPIPVGSSLICIARKR